MRALSDYKFDKGCEHLLTALFSSLEPATESHKVALTRVVRS